MKNPVALMVAILLSVMTGGAYAQADPKPGGEVIVYTALDRQYSEPILKAFEAKSGIKVRAVYDTEAAKTVGLVNRIIAERDRPRCDVFWNNEILRSIQLKREGLTSAYRSPAAVDIPENFKDAEGHWTGFAARARVFVMARNLKGHAKPTRLEELAAPPPDGSGPLAAIAKPLFGTTNTHAAVIWANAGPEKATAFWEAVRKNAAVYPGNGPVADAVAGGEALYGLTDTDDAHSLLMDGATIEVAYPSGGPGGEGTLLLPNTLVLIKGAPNEANAKALIDHLLSREVEATLAASRSAQIPVRAGVPGPAGLPPLAPERVLQVDWERVADSLPAAQKAMHRIFGQ